MDTGTDDASSGALRSATEDPPIASAAAHLARFEFSAAGTKVLMVEWYPGAVPEPAATAAAESSTPAASPDPTLPAPTPITTTAWEVSWPGKTTVLSASDQELDADDHADADAAAPGNERQQPPQARRRRVFFLLPPNAPVPATVTVTPPGAHRLPILLKPLPAIFPPGFEADADAGTRGVLHTIWARRRLAELEREMAAELRANAESVGLEMALAEKQWIVENFLPQPAPPQALPAPPRSPTGGRLGDKLRGLKLATSPAALGTSANTFVQVGSQSQTLSPQDTDVAVSSFSSASAKPAPATAAAPMSLDAALHGTPDPAATAPGRLGAQDPDEDDLFALPLSPRSPDMKKSPFSAL